MKKIAIYGAIDRFNYGDLLFPLILESVLNDWNKDYEIDFYGIIKSDLSNYGAKPTRSIENLFKAETLQDGSALIIAGGDILSARWFEVFSFLLPYSLKNFPSVLKKHIPKKYLSRIKLKLEYCELPQPFVVPPNNFKSKVKVIYNAVGGSGLQYGNYSFRYYFQLINALNQAAYVSVRDKRTKEVLKSLSKELKVQLVPDSATLLSRYFSPELIFKLAKPSTVSWVEQYSGRYIVIQIAQKYCSKEVTIQQIAQQIEEIYERHQLVTILCPIGMATGHEDFLPLSEIKKRVKTPVNYIDDPTLFDIMTLIAHSNLFIGTSLHGAITAMSYAVPNLSFEIPYQKVQDYLNTWALEELRQPVKPCDISKALYDVKLIPKEKLEQKKEELINMSLSSISEIKNSILSENDSEKANGLDSLINRVRIFIEVIRFRFIRLFSKIKRKPINSRLWSEKY